MRFFKSMAVVMSILLFCCATATAADRKVDNRSDPSAELAVINGFRSAQFGMNEKEARVAIKKDFGNDQPKLEQNPAQRTQALVISAKDVLPATPTATISYVLGMTTAKLIQVNVVWGAEGGADLGGLVGAGNALRDYFMQRSYDRESLATNLQLPNGTVLFFKGADAKGSEIRLELYPIPKKDGEKNVPADKGILKLSYADNPKNPDIFRIKDGKF